MVSKDTRLVQAIEKGIPQIVQLKFSYLSWLLHPGAPDKRDLGGPTLNQTKYNQPFSTQVNALHKSCLREVCWQKTISNEDQYKKTGCKKLAYRDQNETAHVGRLCLEDVQWQERKRGAGQRQPAGEQWWLNKTLYHHLHHTKDKTMTEVWKKLIAAFSHPCLHCCSAS